MIASFQKKERGLEHQEKMPCDVVNPEKLKTEMEILDDVFKNKPDNIRELNPAIVVMTVKKQGFIICFTVSNKSFSWFRYPLEDNSLYLTIKCIVIAIVNISCREIKFEEITVTSQLNILKKPAVIMTEQKQVTIGITTHLLCLNITVKVKIKKNSMATPKTFKSFLT